MSLDTATKRRSMLAMGVLALVVHPVPDATIAAIDQKHFLGLMAAVATQTGLATSNVHIFSTSVVEPNHVSDSGDNVLVKGDVEAQGDVYARDWRFTETQTTGALGLQPQTSGAQSRLQLFSKDGDETDNVFIDIFGQGTVADISTFHRLVLGYSQSDNDYIIASASKSLRLHSGGGAIQITLNTDGSTDIGGELLMNDNTISELGSLQYNSATELTISSGAVTITQSHHSIDTEADAANDDLDTINGGNPGEILLILPKDNNRTVRLRNGVGNIFLKHQVESKSFSFASPSGSSGVFYAGGYYNWAAADANLTQASLSVTHSAANSASACHIGIVAGGVGVVDTGVVKLTASGTTIDDEGNRATSQTVTIVADITTLSANDYTETTEKWIGQVTIALATASGSPVNFNLDLNYGCSKYEDFGNQAFTVNTLEVVGRAGANDTGFNLRLFHHSSTGWAYAATGFVPGGTVLANMNTTYSTEKNLVSGESFAYKRVDLNTDISGDNAQGLILEVTTGANKAVEVMDIHFGVHTAPNFSYMASTKQHLIFMKHGPNWLEL